jgi:hypothetical protein
MAIVVEFGNNLSASLNIEDFNGKLPEKFEYEEMSQDLITDIENWNSVKKRHLVCDYPRLIKFLDALNAKSKVYDQIYDVFDSNYVEYPPVYELLSTRTSPKIFWNSSSVQSRTHAADEAKVMNLKHDRRRSEKLYFKDKYNFVYNIHKLESDELSEFKCLGNSLRERILIPNNGTVHPLISRKKFVEEYNKFIGIIFDGEMWDKYNNVFTISGGYVTGLLNGNIDPNSDVDVFILQSRRNDQYKFFNAFHSALAKNYKFKMMRLGRSIMNIEILEAISDVAKENWDEKIRCPPIQVIMSDKRDPVQLITNYDLSHVRTFLSVPFHDGAPVCWSSAFHIASMLTGISFCLKPLVYPKRIRKAVAKNFGIGLIPPIRFLYINGDSRIYKKGDKINVDEIDKISQYIHTKSEEVFNFDSLRISKNLGYMNNVVKIDQRHGHDGYKSVHTIISAVNNYVDKLHKKKPDTKIDEYVQSHFSLFCNISVSGDEEYKRKIQEEYKHYINFDGKFRINMTCFIRDPDMISLNLKEEDVNFILDRNMDSRIPIDLRTKKREQYEWILANRELLREPGVKVEVEKKKKEAARRRRDEDSDDDRSDGEEDVGELPVEVESDDD